MRTHARVTDGFSSEGIRAVTYGLVLLGLVLSLVGAHTGRAGEREDTAITLAFPKAEAYGTVHVEAVIAASPEVVWVVLTDVDRWRGWMPLVMRAQFFSAAATTAIPTGVTKDRALFTELLDQHPGTAGAPSMHGVTPRTTFEAYDLPWPIKNEWVVRHYTYDASQAAKHRFRATWRKAWGDGQPEGYWEISPHGDAVTASRLVYHYRVKAKRGLALGLFKAGVKRASRQLVEAIRREALRR
ncbi:MAG: SRPBCC family protein [Deltaproteobacteria bacterium]|nr:SRPBCC family protein [Deltaproteobacteria bacterium]